MDGELWTALRYLREVIGERNFTMWIQPFTWSGRGNVIRLEVPSPFHREWISRHLLKAIESTLREHLGPQLQFEVVLSAPAQTKLDVGSPPSGDKSRPTPALRPLNSLLRVGRLVDGYDFESFVVGPTNELAALAGRQVAAEPGRRFNPLFVWGGVGLGKTHLVNAIGHEAMRGARNLRLACLSAEMFTNMMIAALRNDKMADFRDRFRALDVLILDDVQFLAGKDRTQEEFFHTFEWLVGAQKQVVLTCDQPPSALARLEARLRSRFEGGLIVDVKAPTPEMRVEILRCKVRRRGYNLSDAILGAIVSRCGPSVREVEGGLNRVLAFVEMMRRPVSVELVEQLLGPERIAPAGRVLTIAQIRDTVAEHFGVSADDLIGSARGRRVSQARQTAMYLCRSVARASLSRIAAEFGGRDHTSVLYAVRAAEQRRESDPVYSAEITRLEQELLRRPVERVASERP
ncbi:Chromosomal replication initiator protein DnaA [bacterium HR30]|nr:Chromosomal replication initiator protein DnaA [bacterium HR30]